MRIPFFGKSDEQATDPVCHMKVSTRKPPGDSWSYVGITYYFCGLGCNRAFQKEPEAYLSGDKKLHM